MLIRIFIFLCIIPIIISISSQEDLTISTYSHIACLLLNPTKQYLINSIQTNSFSTYQTFSSSNLTIELCFRLCRQSAILINQNHTTCICLYTINNLYQFNEQLGKLLSVNNCTTNSLEIYSLSKNFYILPSLPSVYEWTFDGCYYLHGIQNDRPNVLLTNENYIQAINSCRERCQMIRSTDYFSFILSLKKSCYCLPITRSETVVYTAVRKPLIHCSFLPYVKQSFSNFFNDSEVHLDTGIKIYVQRYCSPTFAFDRSLALCLKFISTRLKHSFGKINLSNTCVPMLINTLEQWKHLQLYPIPLNTRTFLWIDRNSSYIFDNLFQSKNISFPIDDLCIVITQIRANQLPSIDLLACSTATLSDYFLCAQNTLQAFAENETEFQISQNKDEFSITNDVSCPINFVLFNNICYYVHPSFVYNIQTGEELCSRKYPNSTLVKLNSHEWGNINATNFLGRTLDDILLEFFYYQLETRSSIELRNDATRKHWLRLLVGEKNSQNECVLRYFTRKSGAFTILHRCDDGGHPVCQYQAIRQNISKLIPMEQTTISISESYVTTESTTSTRLMLINSTNQSSTHIPDPLPDEDLQNNDTKIDYQLHNDTFIHSARRYSRYQTFLMLTITGLLVTVIFIIGTILFVRHIRRSRGSYSTHSNAIGPIRRKKRSSMRTSTSTTAEDQSSTPTVVYTKCKSSPPSTTIDMDMSHPFDDSVNIDDHIQLLPELIQQTRFSEDVSSEYEQKSSNEK